MKTPSSSRSPHLSIASRCMGVSHDSRQTLLSQPSYQPAYARKSSHPSGRMLTAAISTTSLAVLPPQLLKLPLRFIKQLWSSQNIDSSSRQSLPSAHRQTVRFLSSCCLLKIWRMWASELLPLCILAPDPNARAQAGHGVADIALIRACHCRGTNDIYVLSGYTPIKPVEEVSVSTSERTIGYVILIRASGSQLQLRSGSRSTSFKASEDSLLQCIEACTSA